MASVAALSRAAEAPRAPPPQAAKTSPASEDAAPTPAPADKAPATAPDAGPAEQAPPVKRAKEVVVTASRTAERRFDSPYSLNIVDADEIRDKSYRTPTEALRDIPGVMPQKTSLGQGSPFIRGFTGYHNVYLVDGIRLNNSTFRSGPNQYWNTIDPLSISRIEVVKGPGSLLYGSDAVGGVLNAIMKGPQGYGEGFQSGGRLSYRISSAERSQTGRAEGWATWDHKLGLYLGGSIKDFGDLQGGHSVGRQHDTGYDEWDGDFEAEYFINPDTKVVLGHQSVRQDDVPRTHRTVFATTWNGLTRGTDLRHDLTQRRDLTYVQLHAQNLNSWVDAVRLSLSWQEQEETLRRVRAGNRFSKEGVEVGTLGASVQLESPSPIGKLVYGIDEYRDNVNSFSTTNLVQGPVADDAHYHLTGVFLQDTIPVGETFDLTLGGRYEHARAAADRVLNPTTGAAFKVRGEWNSFVAGARGVYHVDQAGHWNVFGGVSQGFRAPNLSDLTRFDIARTNEIETPSPNLEPERFLSYEIGTKAEYQDFTLQASYFYTVIEDLIVRQPTGRIIGVNREVTKINAGNGFVHGVELAPRWRFHPQWTAFGAFTWMTGKVVDFPTAAPVKQWEPVSRLMPTTGEVGLRWDHPNNKLWAEMTGTFAGRQDRLSADDMRDTSRIPPGGTPPYAVLSMRTGYRVTKNVDVTFAIENVTNEDYRIHGSGINEPGRNFILGVEMRF
ncbi:MAG: TonB-dependent receptor [Planctomycetes bacterium]|nr:TonB-dependent receptor [Planctomycetota bacterium]